MTPSTNHQATGAVDSRAGQLRPENRELADSMACSSNSDSIRQAEAPASLARDHTSLHMSIGPDDPVEHYTSFVEVADSVYDKFPRHRKIIIVILLSFLSFLSPISSTSVLAATPEVANEYHTNGTVTNLANAIYMLTMGISPIVWGPLSEVYGRRRVSDIDGRIPRPYESCE